MPWVVRRDEDKCPASRPWGVFNQQTGDLRGCHPTRKHGLRQAAALYASVPDSRPQRAMEDPEDATAVPGDVFREGALQPRTEGSAHG